MVFNNIIQFESPSEVEAMDIVVHDFILVLQQGLFETGLLSDFFVQLTLFLGLQKLYFLALSITCLV